MSHQSSMLAPERPADPMSRLGMWLSGTTRSVRIERHGPLTYYAIAYAIRTDPGLPQWSAPVIHGTGSSQVAALESLAACGVEMGLW